MNRLPSLLVTTLLGIVVLMTGCEQGTSEPVTTDMHEDFDHEHEHQHGDGHDHEHDHDEAVDGAHAHPHSHSHRHGSPLHGGKIVSIGHTHHQDGEAHFHAEVLPVENGRITFYVQTESADGVATDYDFVIEVEAIDAYVNEAGAETLLARDISFVPMDGQSSSSAFVAEIPDDFSTVEKLSVVIPKITLDDSRFSLSFEAEQKASSGEEPNTAADEAPDVPEPGETE